MATTLVKPTAEALKDPEQALRITLRLYEAVQALQNAATSSSIVNLGARTTDPGPPPTGVVYQYTIGGSYYVRTATAPYLVAA